MEIDTFRALIVSIEQSYIIYFLFQKENMNFSNNFLFSGIETSQSSLPPYNNFNLSNYQQFSYPHYFWFDENYFISTPFAYLSYTIQPFLTSDMMFLDQKSSFAYKKSNEIEVSQI